MTQARDVTARKLGYKDLRDAVQKKMEEAGLEILDDPDTEEFKALVGESDVYFSSPEKILKRLKNALKRPKPYQILIYITQTQQKLKETMSRYLVSSKYISRNMKTWR